MGYGWNFDPIRTKLIRSNSIFALFMFGSDIKYIHKIKNIKKIYFYKKKSIIFFIYFLNIFTSIWLECGSDSIQSDHLTDQIIFSNYRSDTDKYCGFIWIWSNLWTPLTTTIGSLLQKNASFIINYY